MPFAPYVLTSRLLAPFTTPLLPEDLLGLIDPLWSTSELRGRVEHVRPETTDATSLVIRPGRGWSGHLAGQYLPVGVDVDGVRSWRTYSICTPPASPLLTITVKAVPGGRVSPHLAHRAAPGDIVRLGPATGEFVRRVPPGTPLLFVTAGSGITPVAAMLRELSGQARAEQAPTDIVLVHSAPTAADVIFGPELRGLPARLPGLRLHEHHTRTAGSRGRLTAADVAALCPDWTARTTFACGPDELLRGLAGYWAAAGAADRLFVERFRVPQPTAGAGRVGRVRFLRSGVRVPANGRTPLLELGERAGVLMPSGCRQGLCHTCLAPLRSGRVRDLRTGREHGEPGDLIQTCVSAAAGAIEIDL